MPNLSSAKSDMHLEPFLENLFIYFENLSFFYLICVSVSFLAVWLTWNIESASNTAGSKEDLTDYSISSENHFSNSSDESNNSNINNTLDKKVLMKSMESSLTNDDRAKESEIEKQQLMDILEIMRKDEKFRSTTMEELQEQLKLYRE